ncbi:MAG: NAD-dependent epimerase/dehydratase family protein [Phycisphaeraceae bacterium]
MERAHPIELPLVTGGSGFTGGALALALRRRGHPVRALVRDPDKAHHLTRAGVQVVRGDVRNPDDVDRAVRGCSHVFHLAAVFRSAGASRHDHHAVHVQGTDNVLASARRLGAQRVIHCSTAGVHGHVREVPSDERSPYNPGDVYQRTKLEGELRAQAAIADGQPVVIVRPAGVYGPGDLRFLKLFRAIHRGVFRMFGSGETTYHLTYIDDLIDAFILAAEHPAALGEIFLACGDEYVTLNELVRLIADAVGVEPPRRHLPLAPLLAAARLCEWSCRPLRLNPPLYMRRCEFFASSRAFTNARMRTRLGFQPRVSLDAGIERTAAWYFANGHLAGAPRAIATPPTPATPAGPATTGPTANGHDPAAPGETDVRRLLRQQNMSRLGKYMWLTTGRRSFLALLRYELVTGLAGSMPGAAGYLARTLTYRGLWGSCGRGVTIGRNVVIRHPHRIHIGDGVVIDDNVVLDAKGDHDHTLVIGDHAIIGRGTILSCKGGTLHVGARANLSCNCTLISETRLDIGDRVLIAGHCYLIAGGNHGIECIDTPIIDQPMTSKGGIAIDQNAWLGANVTVLDGVAIGRDAVIAAGSVVNKPVEAFTIAGGVPARTIRHRAQNDPEAPDAGETGQARVEAEA